MATKAELEEQLAEAQAQLADRAEATVEEPEKKPLSPADAGKDAFLKELDEYQMDIWAHRFESDAFVRAFAWARKRGNETKGCLVYADAHELNHESSDAPVKLEQ